MLGAIYKFIIIIIIIVIIAKLLRGTQIFHEVGQQRPAVVQRAPSHCGPSESEKADEIAKHGAKGRQQDHNVTFQEQMTLIRTALGQRIERNDFHLTVSPSKNR